MEGGFEWGEVGFGVEGGVFGASAGMVEAGGDDARVIAAFKVVCFASGS